MIIRLKKKDTLICDDFQFRCSIGKKGVTNSKVEGDLCTPKGTFRLKEIFLQRFSNFWLVLMLSNALS